MANWTLSLDELSLGGLAPRYFEENYPRWGNSNTAGAMKAMDFSRPGYIQPGPAPDVYPGSAAAVSSTITGMCRHFTDITKSYGVGGDKFYQLATSASLLHTISASTASTTFAHDVVGFRDNYYYSWMDNDGVANIGKFDGTSTFDDDWWTGTLSAAALQPYPQNITKGRTLLVGGNDILYFNNLKYVGSYDGTTGLDQALDFPSNSVISDINWLADRVYVAVNSNSYAGYSSIYLWDGTTNSWEAEIPVLGASGAGYVNNGVYYHFYTDTNGTSKLARLEGGRILDLASFEGTVPLGYQVTDWNGFIIWRTSRNVDEFTGAEEDFVMAWGSPGDGSPARLFKFADLTGNTTNFIGGISNTNTYRGLVVSVGNELYNLDTYSKDSFEVDSNWKSLLFDVAGSRINSGQINFVRFNFEALATGASLNWSLVNNKGVTVYTDTISYAKATASNPLHTLTTAFYPLNGLVTDNFRIELDYSGGSSTNPVRIMNIKIYGEG